MAVSVLRVWLLACFFAATPAGGFKFSSDSRRGGGLLSNRLPATLISPNNAESEYNPKRESKYVGVSWYRRDKVWESQISVDNRKVRIGFFESEEAAARAYDARAGPLGRPVNFPSRPHEVQSAKRGAHGVRSRFTGVYYEARSRKWKVQIKVDREVVYLGLYDSEVEAARVYDAKGAAPLGRPVNFPAPGQAQARKQGTSQFLGVYWSGARKSWEAVALENRTYEHLGYFGLEEDAARAYDAHMERTHGRRPKNFPVPAPSAAAAPMGTGMGAGTCVGTGEEAADRATQKATATEEGGERPPPSFLE